MATESTSTLILIGAGSVGRSHARAASSRYRDFIIVDPVSDARNSVAALLPGNVTQFGSLEEAIEQSTSEFPAGTAIVCNWGPDHAETFDRLCRAGVRRVLVEKPMATSPFQAFRMAEIAESLGIRVIVGNSRRYTGMVNFISTCFLAADDEPQTFVVHGGALCTVTNGIHWLDLACAVFGQRPASTTADLVDGRLNPRSPHLGYWGGTATWQFSEDRRLTVTYSNSSSVGGHVSIYGRRSRLDIDDNGEMWFAERDPAEVLGDDRVTRYGPVTSRRQKVSFRPRIDATTTMLELLEGSDPLFPEVIEHAYVVEAMLASLYASELGGRVALPLERTSPAYHREWAAS